MKNTLTLSLFLLPFIILAQAPPQPPCSAGGNSTFTLETISYEDMSRTGISHFQVKLKAIDSTYIDLLYFSVSNNLLS